MGKIKWVCANCGMHSSRKCNVKRHIQNFHSGSGAIVSFIDYLVGRSSGFYPPSTPPTYVKKDASETVLDIVRKEFPKVVLKEAVSHQFDKRFWHQQSGAQLQYQQFLYQSQYLASYIQEHIFGFRARICDRCMVTEVTEVFYDGSALRQREHVCHQEWVSEFAKLSDSERERGKENLKSQISDSLKKSLSGWKHDNMYALQAIRISPDNLSDGHIRLHLKKAGQPMSVTLPYAERDITKLEANNNAQWLYYFNGIT